MPFLSELKALVFCRFFIIKDEKSTTNQKNLAFFLKKVLLFISFCV